MKYLKLTAVIAISTFVAGCGSGSSSSNNQSGTMSLRITDAPIDDAASVVVEFSEVQIRGTDTSQNLNFALNPPKSIDLLALQGGDTEALFTDETVPAGIYDEVRLIINAEAGTDDTYIILEVGGAQHEMTIPSGAESGLKVKGSFTVPAGGEANFTVDFDVRKSIVVSGNVNSANGIKYHLKPVLRIVDNTEVGSIAGTVDGALLTENAGCSDTDIDTHNAVYVFAGSGITPDDIDGLDAEPIVTALVGYDADSDSHIYQASFLLAGDFTVSFTCNADAEDVNADDDLKFVETQDIVVIVGETGIVNFPAPVP